MVPYLYTAVQVYSTFLEALRTLQLNREAGEVKKSAVIQGLNAFGNNMWRKKTQVKSLRIQL